MSSIAPCRSAMSCHKRMLLLHEPGSRYTLAIAEPLFEYGKARAGCASLHFGDERWLVLAQRVNVNVMPAAAEVAGAGQWVSLGMNTECLVPSDDLTLEARPFLTMAGAAYRCAPSVGGGVCPERRRNSLSAWRVTKRRPPTRTDRSSPRPISK
jgi:hypothetical protein